MCKGPEVGTCFCLRSDEEEREFWVEWDEVRSER